MNRVLLLAAALILTACGAPTSSPTATDTSPASTLPPARPLAGALLRRELNGAGSPSCAGAIAVNSYEWREITSPGPDCRDIFALADGSIFAVIVPDYPGIVSLHALSDDGTWSAALPLPVNVVGPVFLGGRRALYMAAWTTMTGSVWDQNRSPDPMEAELWAAWRSTDAGATWTPFIMPQADRINLIASSVLGVELLTTNSPSGEVTLWRSDNGDLEGQGYIPSGPCALDWDSHVFAGSDRAYIVQPEPAGDPTYCVSTDGQTWAAVASSEVPVPLTITNLLVPDRRPDAILLTGSDVLFWNASANLRATVDNNHLKLLSDGTIYGVPAFSDLYGDYQLTR